MRALCLAVAGAMALACAFAAGWMSRPDAQPSPSRPLAGAIDGRSGPAAVCPSVSDLREAVHAELAAARAPEAPARAASEPAPVFDDGALARAHDVLEQGMADGVWTEGDVEALRAAVTGLDGDALGELASILFPALNSGRLRIATAGPPF
jgi:hypothetical protein